MHHTIYNTRSHRAFILSKGTNVTDTGTFNVVVVGNVDLCHWPNIFHVVSSPVPDFLRITIQNFCSPFSPFIFPHRIEESNPCALRVHKIVF